MLDEKIATQKPLILVTNDDGIFSSGIHHLVACASRFGEVVVVAPNSPQSGMGHAITIEDPIRLHQVEAFGSEIVAYECSGTPVDCVKLAKNIVLKDRTIDLCVSGINHGSNASINILYSGTMSAAMEASIEGIPSIGFSLMNYSPDANFSACLPYVCHIIELVLTQGLHDCRLLNVNIPDLPSQQISGIRVCRQSRGNWAEEFIQGTDPRGQHYYWLTGHFDSDDAGSDTDVGLLADGYITIVPSHHDLTSYPGMTSNHHLNSGPL